MIRPFLMKNACSVNICCWFASGGQRRLVGCLLLLLGAVCSWSAAAKAQPIGPLRIDWSQRYLTITADNLPGDEIKIHYLEAYCRPGSTDRAWQDTVIGHRSVRLAQDAANTSIRLRDTLNDGVIVDHQITARQDVVEFHVTARNPTAQRSEAHWAQPCLRVGGFCGVGCDDPVALYPAYIRQCFLYVDGKPTWLPTEPWARQARYTPGQVYCPGNVDRNDVNPRPLSPITPSHGLCGCVSADRKWLLATAWTPYQEIFQGVICCLHNDFRIGGLDPGEEKRIEGRLYVVPNDMEALWHRFQAESWGDDKASGRPPR